jgi:uncharacterized protein involved in outer membrane biogenesis
MRAYRWLIITAGVVIGLAILAIALGTVWLNSFIHSPGFHDEVESRAAQSVGDPVQIQTINFDILHGIELRGLVTQIDAGHDSAPGALKVSVAQVNCTYSLFDLLVGKLRLTGVTLDQPQITLTKQASEPTPATTPPDAAATPGGTPTSPAGSSSGGTPFQFVLDRAKVSDGSLTVLDASGTTLVDLHGIDAQANTSGFADGRDVTGTLRIAQATASNLEVKSFSSPVTYHPNFLSAKPFEATAFSGRLAGDFLLDGSGPSILDLNGNGLNVEQLAAATTSSSAAHLTGSLDFQSKWRGVESGELDGEGDAQLAHGKLENVKILRQVSSILRVAELSDPDITKATTHFVVRDRVVNFNGLQLDSPLFSITGHGTVGFEGGLSADLVLILTRDAMGKLPKELQSSFVQQPDGTGTTAFHVSGTTSNPQTDLPQRLLMQNTQIKNVLDKALNKFFH